jgi:hypothetical protein
MQCQRKRKEGKKKERIKIKKRMKDGRIKKRDIKEVKETERRWKERMKEKVGSKQTEA